jgi:hypothetical protein
MVIFPRGLIGIRKKTICLPYISQYGIAATKNFYHLIMAVMEKFREKRKMFSTFSGGSQETKFLKAHKIRLL